MARPAGYSGKPLWQKLGLKPGMTCCVIYPPVPYEDLVEGAQDIVFIKEGSADLVHLFCRKRADLEAAVKPALAQVAPGGMLWVSWPKKSSALYLDLTEDGLREVLLPTGWVDVKVCAVDADWSGLKFLKRKT